MTELATGCVLAWQLVDDTKMSTIRGCLQRVALRCKNIHTCFVDNRASEDDDTFLVSEFKQHLKCTAVCLVSAFPGESCRMVSACTGHSADCQGHSADCCVQNSSGWKPSVSASALSSNTALKL